MLSAQGRQAASVLWFPDPEGQCLVTPTENLPVTAPRPSQVFREEKYLKDAVECSDVIWQRGLLRKGYGLCHGTAGNGYAFLSLYHLTQDRKYLYRACKVRPLSTALDTPGGVHTQLPLLSPASVSQAQRSWPLSTTHPGARPHSCPRARPRPVPALGSLAGTTLPLQPLPLSTQEHVSWFPSGVPSPHNPRDSSPSSLSLGGVPMADIPLRGGGLGPTQRPRDALSTAHPPPSAQPAPHPTHWVQPLGVARRGHQGSALLPLQVNSQP